MKKADNKDEKLNMNLSWKILDETTVIKDSWIDMRASTCQLPGGMVIAPFYVNHLPDFAVVVAVTPEHRVIMVRQYRHGVEKVLLELPAGCIEAGEDPKDGAAREEDLLKMKVSSLAGQALFLPPFLILVRLVSRRFALRILYNIVCVEGGNQLFENFHAFPCCFNSDVSGVFLVPHFPDFIISLRVDRIPILFGHDLRGLLSSNKKLLVSVL